MNSALSTAAGGSTVVLFAKMYLQRSLTELERLVKMMAKVNTDLAAITVKLESMEKNDNLLRIHDRKIAALESVFYAKKPNSGHVYSVTNEPI